MTHYIIPKYENACLAYISFNKHEGENVRLYDTVLSAKENVEGFVNEE